MPKPTYFFWLTSFATGMGFGMIISHTIFSLILWKYYKEYMAKGVDISTISPSMKGLLDTDFLKGMHEVISSIKKPINKKNNSL
jgi:hypothetical protein